MHSLPRVTEQTCEKISREFDNLGPEACAAEITAGLQADNPELLDMASRCAKDLDRPGRLMVGFSMFYRLLMAQAAADFGQSSLHPLPQVTTDSRDEVVREIDHVGSHAFTESAIDELETTNPELLRMAHNFALRQPNYLGVMQGFALLYRSLMVQSAADGSRPH